jgi:hypothetical protein
MVWHWLGVAFCADSEALQFTRFLHIAYQVLCIPFSSAAVERGFSVSGIVKNVTSHCGSCIPLRLKLLVRSLCWQHGSEHCCVQYKPPSR